MLYLRVIVDHPLQRVGDAGQAGRVGAVGDAQGDDVHAGRDAQVVGVVGADQAGDGRAVLRGGGHGIGGVVGEVVAGDDLVAGPEAAAQGRVVVIDAGVDHGDGHSGSVDVVGRAACGGADDRVVGRGRAGLDRAGRPLEPRELRARDGPCCGLSFSACNAPVRERAGPARAARWAHDRRGGRSALIASARREETPIIQDVRAEADGADGACGGCGSRSIP